MENINSAQSDSDLNETFVQSWLVEAESKSPGSLTLKAISDSTNLDRLDEARLVKRLRELAKASPKEKAS